MEWATDSEAGSMTTETYRRGWGKTHKGICGGIVRFVENLSETHWEWDLECISCGKLLTEEDVDFFKRLKGYEREIRF